MPTRTLAPVLQYLRQIEAAERGDSDRELLARFVRHGDEAAFAFVNYERASGLLPP